MNTGRLIKRAVFANPAGRVQAEARGYGAVCAITDSVESFIGNLVSLNGFYSFSQPFRLNFCVTYL